MLTPQQIRERERIGASSDAGLYRSLEQIALHEVKVEGVLTGLPYIDRLTGGLRPGKLNLAGGYSANGKTALMLSTGVRQMDEDAPFLFFSSDDSDDTLLCKVLSMVYELPLDEVEMNGPKWRAKAVKSLEGQLLICTPQNSSTYTADQIKLVYEEVANYWGRPPRFCCFDYLSLLALNQSEDGFGAIKAKAAALKRLARDTDDSVWLIGHQCRKDAGADCHALSLNHLEFGGHQEADGVVLGCRRRLTTTKMAEWEEHLEEHTPTTNVSVMKNKITGKTSPNPIGTPYVIDAVTGLLRPFTEDEERARAQKGKGAAGPLARPTIVYKRQAGAAEDED